ncbi:hypothetical protein [Agrobacterium fabrum]|uniref:hypothetical protein n=1 Tax=Agrobacterium fabrum TaxID=1176649 RepID=UPI0021582B56|nr:hypothetical protein [Agrobacterium fabrum]MCR6727599.1 hypothetical protein [Agrobacterium fabrum]WLP57515.1 hypothetical protein Q8X45_23675 [Agrobacterium fabrum]
MTEWPKKYADRAVGKQLFDYLADEQDTAHNAKYDLLEQMPYVDRLMEIFNAWLNREGALLQNEKVYYCLCSYAKAQLFAGCAHYMRGHLTTGFMTSRLALDAALYAEAIAAGDLSLEDYFTNERKRNGISRHYWNLQRQGSLPNNRIEPLMRKINVLSSHAAHAEPKVWFNRLDETHKEHFSFSLFEKVESDKHYKYFFHSILWFSSMALQSFLCIAQERFSLDTGGLLAEVEAWQDSMEVNKENFDISAGPDSALPG